MTDLDRWRVTGATEEIRPPPSEPRPGKRRAQWLAVISALIVVPLTSCGGYFYYLNWAAEKKAREYCAMLPPGALISSIVARAVEEKVRHYEYEGGRHVFVFPIYWTDEAVCVASVDRQGRVVSSQVQLHYD